MNTVNKRLILKLQINNVLKREKEKIQNPWRVLPENWKIYSHWNLFYLFDENGNYQGAIEQGPKAGLKLMEFLELR